MGIEAENAEDRAHQREPSLYDGYVLEAKQARRKMRRACGRGINDRAWTNPARAAENA